MEQTGEESARREPWFGRAARGAGAGVVATAAMSVVQFPGASSGGHLPPPIEITRRLHRATGRRARPRQLFARGIALHLAFGAVAGSLYAVVAPRRFRELSATAYAGLLYGASYRGYLPALALHQHASDDAAPRQRTNLAAHAIFGLALAEVLRVTDPAAEQDSSPT
jgi:hypothetical protein